MGKLNGCTSPMSGKENMAPAHSSSNSTVVYIEHGVDGDKKGRDMKLPCTWDSNGGSVSVLRMVDVALRSVVVAFLVVGLCSMLTSTQHSQVTVLGLSFPVSLKWTRSQPFMFLVVVEAMVSGYAAAQFVYQSVVLARKAAPSRGRMSFQLAADQDSHLTQCQIAPLYKQDVPLDMLMKCSYWILARLNTIYVTINTF